MRRVLPSVGTMCPRGKPCLSAVHNGLKEKEQSESGSPSGDKMLWKNSILTHNIVNKYVNLL